MRRARASLLAALAAALLLLAAPPARSAAHTAPTVEMTAPAAGATYRDGEPVALRGSGSSGTTLAWHAALRTASGEDAVADAAGPEAGFVPRDDLGADVSYAITLTATDDDGQSASVTREIHAEVAALALRSDPPGASIGWGAAPFAATPFDVSPAVGQRSWVEAGPELESGGCRFLFDRWSDGGERRHALVAPVSPATLTALYAPAPGACAAAAPQDGVEGSSLGSARRRGPEVELSLPRAPTRVLRGTAGDPDGVLFVKVALRRAGGGLGCRWWSSRTRRFQRVRTSCARPHWMTARVSGGTWRLDLRARLRPGRYVLVFRSADRRGAVAQGLADGIQQVPLQLFTLPGR